MRRPTQTHGPARAPRVGSRAAPSSLTFAPPSLRPIPQFRRGAVALAEGRGPRASRRGRRRAGRRRRRGRGCPRRRARGPRLSSWAIARRRTCALIREGFGRTGVSVGEEPRGPIARRSRKSKGRGRIEPGRAALTHLATPSPRASISPAWRTVARVAVCVGSLASKDTLIAPRSPLVAVCGGGGAPPSHARARGATRKDPSVRS